MVKYTDSAPENAVGYRVGQPAALGYRIGSGSLLRFNSNNFVAVKFAFVHQLVDALDSLRSPGE